MNFQLLSVLAVPEVAGENFLEKEHMLFYIGHEFCRLALTKHNLHNSYLTYLCYASNLA